MKDYITLEQAINLLQQWEDRLGSDAKFKIQIGNGYDIPQFDTANEDGVKFLYVC
jgi:hypothetical protein